MNKVIEFDEAQSTLYCEAGCILETLQNHTKDLGYMMPLDLGAKGSCQIGGNLATNAGGIKFIKQGSMHSNCVGLKVVLADGTIIDQMDPHVTLPIGYDLKQLFIGAEGTLGFITECAIFCPPYPKNRQVALLASNDYEQIMKCLQISKKELSSQLSAVEFMDWESASIAMDYLSLENPLSDEYKYYILIEMSGNSQEELLQEQMLELLEKLEDHYEDGLMCESETQKDQIWHIREGISMAASGYGLAFKFDISLESKDFEDIILKTQERVNHLGGRVLGHGHIGDGNLHLNTVMKGFKDMDTAKQIKEALQPFVFDYIKEKNGSVSAEHGIGLLKTDYLGHSKSSEMIGYMGMLKKVFDPKGILNPYKVLPDHAFKPGTD
uniref:FAD-binding PCMH-type domain-containing protein n=1 Tax=Strombidium rassoulzadegani TaxID=1082188 RepID=A0A7S3CK84_9SPIT|mmetsp:Transcript_13317/g.22623  ORF Transcript_13317/g.22623 Transcript_13317/m.22623 type:complete len:381 (+) Transcript_13317:673-1815(+)